MKKLSLLLMVFVFAISIFSCKKKDNNNQGSNNNNTACNGMNLCFKIDGTQESHNATWKVLTDRNRIYWEDAGTPYKNIEIDFYGTTTGTYQISANPTTGQAGFQYFIGGTGGKNIQGQSGTLEVTSISGTQITGTFTVTASDGSTTYQITEGNFVNVPQ